MAYAARETSSQPAEPTPADGTLPFQPLLECSTVFSEWLRFQRTQLDALSAWQASVVELNQELWGQWMSLWSGGVPIDA